MIRRAGVLIGLALAIVAVAGIGWIYRLEILLEIVEIRLHVDVAPTRAVEWDSGSDPAGRPEAERPPNIVVILADDLGWNDLSWLGGGVAGGTVPTPNIDSLAREGIHFANGYAANGTCAPSRAALMTGRYGTRFGFEFTPTPAGFSTLVPLLGNTMPGTLRNTLVEDVGPSIPYDDMGVPASEITLAELLAPAGYHSVHIGKWHLGHSGGMAPHDQGFDESLLMASGLYLPEDHPDVVNSKQDFDGIDRFLWRAMQFSASFNGGPEFEPDGYLTDYYTDQAVRAIEANRNRPFFLYLAHWAVHTPLQALKDDYDALSHIEEHRLRVYAAMVRSLDRSVGGVLAALRENGLEENTLVFFTSDNGAPAYIGLPRVNEPFRGWKISFFEGGIHVPFFLKWPARLTGGQTFEAPVHGFDIFSTAAAAAGVELPRDRIIDGVDLVPFVAGEAEGVPHERLFWRTGGYQAVLADGYKLQISDPPGRTWLFHLPSDPTEQRNLADAAPTRVDALRELLAEHNVQQAAPLWPSAVASPINVDKTLLDPDAPDDDFIYWFN
ncbi:MAG: sulfatase-like hydrolase/transferase [Gammaproteobacteria bacterium]|nr:sulfatase-like hydrolase/transferase [Gammaproteobacteria bacterium]